MSFSSNNITKNELTSEDLVASAINELNCNKYFDEYKQCMMRNAEKHKYKECVNIIDHFR